MAKTRKGIREKGKWKSGKRNKALGIRDINDGIGIKYIGVFGKHMQNLDLTKPLDSASTTNS